MYIIGNKTYSEPGYILYSKQFTGYSLPTNDNIIEVPVNYNDMYVKEDMIHYNNYLRIQNHPSWSYAQWKDKLVKIRYSPEDQIAIMLNKNDSDKDLEYYNKMQQWREWCSGLAKKIIEVNSIEK